MNLGYLGVKLPDAINTTGLTGYIRITSCPPPGPGDYEPLEPFTGSLITDNIDAVWDQSTDYSNDIKIYTQIGAVLTEESEATGMPINSGLETSSALDAPEFKLRFKYISGNFKFVNILSPPPYLDNSTTKTFPIMVSYTGWSRIIEMTSTICVGCLLPRLVEDDASGMANSYVYPNPVSTYFTLSNFEFSSGNPINIYMYNAMGQLIKTWQNLSADDITNYEFNLNTISEGCYIIEARSGAEVIRTKLIKAD
jgi:hypothetical protein